MATNFKIVHINQTITSKLLRKNIRVHMKCFKSKIIKKFTPHTRGAELGPSRVVFITQKDVFIESDIYEN